MTAKVVGRKCGRATKSTGKPCQRAPIAGGTVCIMHGGQAPQVKKKAAVRAELESWGLGDATDDPGVTLLRLITQSRRRADALAAAIDTMIEAAGGDLTKALVGDTMTTTESGETVKTGEYYRILATKEAEERDRLANFCTKAIAAGLAERVVRMQEREAALAHAALIAGLDAAGITGDTRTRVLTGAANHLRLITTG